MIKDIEKNIFDILVASDKSLRLNEICRLLNVSADSPDYLLLKEKLKEMVNNGLVVKLSRRRYKLFEKIQSDSYRSKIIGIIRIYHNRGIVVSERTKNKITIKQKYLNTALDGDTVEVVMLARKREKKNQGEVVAVLKRANNKIVGTLEHDGYFWFLVPDDERYYMDFLIPKNKLNGAQEGDKVSARFVKWDNPQKSPEAEIISVIGSSGGTSVEYDAILPEFSLSSEFNSKTIAEVNKISIGISAREISNRKDLRKLDVITIDPDDAKDFDDALSLELLENGNSLLGVHIADVSYYVKTGSSIDKEAFGRGNSTYLVDRVVPMLPELLSNDVCSLKPKRNRMAYSVFMEVSKSGAVKSYEIVESVIKSKRRFSYEEILQIIETGEGEYSDLIGRLDSLASVLRHKRLKQGGINFDTVEIKFKLDASGQPYSAKIKTSNRATELVEECMLLANKTVAEHVLKLSKQYGLKDVLPFFYRVHDKPNENKLNAVLEFIMLLGHKGDARGGKAKDINKLLAQFEGRPEKPIVHSMLVRAMPRAEYSSENIGHFGLGFRNYSHFTSPIRRYPDLIVHRLLKEYNSGQPDEARIKSLVDWLEYAGEHTTETERNSMEAERASVKLASCFLAQKHIGEVFEGTISGVTSFGLFVLLDNIYAEGLLHIRDLLDDYYEFDEKYFRLVGKRTKQVFQFGRRIKAKVVKVSIEKRKIDLQFVKY